MPQAERIVAARIALELAVIMDRQSGAYRKLAKKLKVDPYDDCARELTAINEDFRLAIRLGAAMRELYDPRISSPAFVTETITESTLRGDSSNG